MEFSNLEYRFISPLFLYYILVTLLLLLDSINCGSGGADAGPRKNVNNNGAYAYNGHNNNNNGNGNGNGNGTTTTLNKLLLKKLSTNNEFDSILEELLFPAESNSLANCDHHHGAFNITDKYGFVKSPRFPSGYRVPLFCRWNIVGARPDEIITISFEEMDIEIPNESLADCRRTSKPKFCCDRNYLKISSGNSINEQLYCGATAPSQNVFISSSNQVSIAFNATINRKDARGFYFTYSVGPRSSLVCAPNEFHCNNGKCIPPKWLCNNRDECGDNSDETLCPSSQDNLERCNDDESEFYHRSKRCDSTFDCRNKADELGCFGCAANKFMCRSTQTCIDASSICNGVADCEDFDDELNCGVCPPGKVQCGSMSSCYDPYQQRCNRVLDCPNGIDEVNCFEECRGRISCGNASGCFEMDERCNGIVQCADFSDEKNCSLDLCRPDKGSFLCSNGRCIPSLWTCDRSADCYDGSDEMRCIKNSVITAAIIGSLICGLLVVIAISCACKLVALRKMEQYRRSLSSTSSYPPGTSLHSAEFPFSSNPGDLDASLFRLDHSVFFREPPPSYATTMGGYQDVNGANNSYMEQYRRYRRQRRCRRMMRRQHRQNQNTLQLSNNNNNNNSGSDGEPSLQACLTGDHHHYHNSTNHITNGSSSITQPYSASALSSTTTVYPVPTTTATSTALVPNTANIGSQSSPIPSPNNHHHHHHHLLGPEPSDSPQYHQHPKSNSINSKFTNLVSLVSSSLTSVSESTASTNTITSAGATSTATAANDKVQQQLKRNSSSIPNVASSSSSTSSSSSNNGISSGGSGSGLFQSTSLSGTSGSNYLHLQYPNSHPHPHQHYHQQQQTPPHQHPHQQLQPQQQQPQHQNVDNLNIELEPIPALTNFDCDSQPLIR